MELTPCYPRSASTPMSFHSRNGKQHESLAGVLLALSRCGEGSRAAPSLQEVDDLDGELYSYLLYKLFFVENSRIVAIHPLFDFGIYLSFPNRRSAVRPQHCSATERESSSFFARVFAEKFSKHFYFGTHFWRDAISLDACIFGNAAQLNMPFLRHGTGKCWTTLSTLTVFAI